MDKDLPADARQKMTFAYADPPYPNQARLYSREARSQGRTSREVNHALLVSLLVDKYPDGWALSTSASALSGICRLIPEMVKVRVLSWHKPFVPAYKGIRPIYSWEPVILCGGRPATLKAPLIRDSLTLSPRMGLRPRQTTAPTGAKPPLFCRWVLDCLNFQPGDQMDDLFPGTGIMGDVVNHFQLRLIEVTA